MAREMTWGDMLENDYPELKAPDPDGHGVALDSSATAELLRKAKRSSDPIEQKALRVLARTTAKLWNSEELNNLRQRLLEDEELWDEIPTMLE